MPEDIKSVALNLLVMRDGTLNEVYNLEHGEAAKRECVGGQWIRYEVEHDNEQNNSGSA